MKAAVAFAALAVALLAFGVWMFSTGSSLMAALVPVIGAVFAGRASVRRFSRSAA